MGVFGTIIIICAVIGAAAVAGAVLTILAALLWILGTAIDVWLS